MKSGKQQHCRPSSQRVHGQSMPLLSFEATVGIEVAFARWVNKMCSECIDENNLVRFSFCCGSRPEKLICIFHNLMLISVLFLDNCQPGLSFCEKILLTIYQWSSLSRSPKNTSPSVFFFRLKTSRQWNVFMVLVFTCTENWLTQQPWGRRKKHDQLLVWLPCNLITALYAKRLGLRKVQNRDNMRNEPVQMFEETRMILKPFNMFCWELCPYTGSSVLDALDAVIIFHPLWGAVPATNTTLQLIFQTWFVVPIALYVCSPRRTG